jgi:hypothetical protein
VLDDDGDLRTHYQPGKDIVHRLFKGSLESVTNLQVYAPVIRSSSVKMGRRSLDSS